MPRETAGSSPPYQQSTTNTHHLNPTKNNQSNNQPTTRALGRLPNHRAPDAEFVGQTSTSQASTPFFNCIQEYTTRKIEMIQMTRLM